MIAREIYDSWMNSSIIDDATKEELSLIKDDDAEIEERFYTDLEFGTGGLRGVMGAGTNRMNIYTVRKATQGLANYLLNEFDIKDCSVVIAYDNRNNSKTYAEETASCLIANGIKVYIFDSLRPTPMLSYAVRFLGCNAGVNITASHNPKEYNGYKVYGPDGSQVVPPMDKAIMKEVRNIADLAECKFIDVKELSGNELYNVLDNSVDDAFIAELHKMVIRKDVIDKASDLSFIYTPLHGTGLVPVTRVLAECGFKNVTVVPEQEKPDGDFPTVRKPNPEEAEAFECALQLAKTVRPELILASDPDADRLGICALDKKTGEYVRFTGNMMGALLTEYVLSSKKELGTMPENPAVVSTVVITDLVRKICDNYGVYCEDKGLIGFKHIAKKIREYEENNTYNYVFGLEDSDGCLPGTYARDKDAIGAVMLLCEAAAYYHTKNMTLWDQMVNIYEKYGYFAEDLKTKKIAGVDGQERIASMIAKLRENPYKEIAGNRVITITDYKLKKHQDMISGKVVDADIDSSNMIYYRLENDGWFLVRPSGTEPKIKFYMGIKGESIVDSRNKLEGLCNYIMDMFD